LGIAADRPSSAETANGRDANGPGEVDSSVLIRNRPPGRAGYEVAYALAVPSQETLSDGCKPMSREKVEKWEKL
jgi:hypothetical protein